LLVIKLWKEFGTVNIVPEKVRARRKEMGLSQEILAEKSGLSVGTISDIERGLVTKVKEVALFKLSKALLYDPEDLLEEGETNE
jgi:transcriptional regulator with XRE-family HTH domain